MKGLAVLVFVACVVAEAPYPPSGWKPSGERLRLPVRNSRIQAPVPHAVYGPPTSEAPVETVDTQYGAPANPDDQYGAPAPDNGYGAPAPDNSYGAPAPDNGYGAPAPDNGYGAPAPDNGYGAPAPDSGYGAPQQPDAGYGPPQQPDSSYGAPAPSAPSGEYGAPPQQPDSGYGAPQQPDSGYGAPQQPDYEVPQEGSNLPVDPGASERLRQSQFIQQLPNYQPSRFTAQNRPLRQQALQAQRLPTQQRTQMFRRPPPQNFRQVQLYTTPTPIYTSTAPTSTAPPENDAVPEEPTVAVATAVSGLYYVLQTDGLLQRITYSLKNGRVTDGQIEPNLKYEDIRPLKGPVYIFNEQNQLVRINSR